MENSPPRNRPVLPVALGLLVLLCLAWAVNQFHLGALEGELQHIADEKLAEFQADQPEGEAEPWRMAAAVVVAKPYVFFGPPAGKIAVYIERPGPDGERHIEGVDYFFVREAEENWRMTESGMCTSEECSIEGKRLIDDLAERF